MKGLIVAFSMYSKIPMPRFNWDTKDMKYHLCFFPLVGAVIGLLEYAWFCFVYAYGLPYIMFACIAVAIPLLVTGGFHVDGFLDTMDAFHSYQERERKLEILKDPHIGAFAVICLAIYLLVAVGFVPAISGEVCARELCFAFVLSRIGSGLGVTYFAPAKRDGMLHAESANNSKKIVGLVLWVELVICFLVMLWMDYVLALVMLGVATLFTLYYRWKVYKEFGGITGDTAGYYVTMIELLLLLGVAITNMIRLL